MLSQPSLNCLLSFRRFLLLTLLTIFLYIQCTKTTCLLKIRHILLITPICFLSNIQNKTNINQSHQIIHELHKKQEIVIITFFIKKKSLTASICSRARAASFCCFSLAMLSFRIESSFLATLSLWRWPSSWFRILVGLFDINILQKSHHLLPWLTQYCKFNH